MELFATRQKQEQPGKLISCVGCSAIGRVQLGRYREPARPVKASPVSDVHVLAQSMIHRAERKRLLVFSDNRQDAAFQAGWMQDHARRYRLRALMFVRLSQTPLQIGTLVSQLDQELDQDDDLSQALCFRKSGMLARKKADLQGHAAERRHFLRILVLREVAYRHQATDRAGTVGPSGGRLCRTRAVGTRPPAPRIATSGPTHFPTEPSLRWARSMGFTVTRPTSVEHSRPRWVPPAGSPAPVGSPAQHGARGGDIAQGCAAPDAPVRFRTGTAPPGAGSDCRC